MSDMQIRPRGTLLGKISGRTISGRNFLYVPAVIVQIFCGELYISMAQRSSNSLSGFYVIGGCGDPMGRVFRTDHSRA
jgi:hypothetical protein